MFFLYLNGLNDSKKFTCVSCAIPLHPGFPGLPLLQFLVRVRDPPPQLALQEPQEPHSPQAVTVKILKLIFLQKFYLTNSNNLTK